MIKPFIKSHRYKILVPLFLLLLIPSIPMGIYVINAMTHPLFGIHKAGTRIVDRSKDARLKAQEFNQSRALRQLGKSSINGYTYRFDDNILDARPGGRSASLETQRESVGIAFEFDPGDQPGMWPKQRNHRIDDGVLHYRHNPENYLENSTDLSIEIGRIAEIEVRVKVQQSITLVLGWSTRMDAHPLDPSATDYLKIRSVPDGRFHTYRINARPVMKSFSHSGDTMRRLFLFPLNIDSDEIQLDYLRMYSLEEKYGRKTHDVVYETINNEMRPGIYMHTATRLRYPLALLPGENRLAWGMGLLASRQPLDFTISVESQGVSTEVFHETLSKSEVWYDREVDLTKFSARDIEIVFSLHGPPNSIGIWSNPRIYQPPGERFNVIIVLEDALRADRLSSYGYQFQTTPVKDALAAGGVLFENAVSQATHTRASCASFMTSLYPSATGVWNAGEALDDNYLTLAEILRSQGYTTAMFTQNVNAGPNAGLHQGFSYISNTEASGNRAVQIYQGERLREWLADNSQRNFFLYLHILDPHGPYDPPESIAKRYQDQPIPGKIAVERDPLLDPDWLEAPTAESRNFLYNDEIVVNDVAFKALLQQLEELQLTQNTLMIFISDHGEHMGEHGLWDHKPPGYRQVLRVPLIMVQPGKLPANRRISPPVQLLDIMPTILDLAQIPRQGLMLQGDSLMPLIAGQGDEAWQGRASLSEEVKLRFKGDRYALGSLFYGGHHLLYSDRLQKDWAKQSPDQAPRTQRLGWMRLFSLLENPTEAEKATLIGRDLILQYRTERLLSELRRTNLDIWRQLTTQQERAIAYDPGEIEQLRELGYIK